jgi:hypothetical protein
MNPFHFTTIHFGRDYTINILRPQSHSFLKDLWTETNAFVFLQPELPVQLFVTSLICTRGKGALIKHHAMKAYGGVEV